jgi:GMP synthase (glutamine-hydrolysing)
MEDILLLNASTEDSAVRNFRRELPACVHVVSPETDNFSSEMISLDSYEGFVISGSSHSVLDDMRWIDKMESLVQRCVRKNVPILGVCWGHQLIASALGGTVERGERRELGYVDVSVESGSEILEGIRDGFEAFASHTDYVTELPDDADMIAGNSNAIQGFRYGSAYGVQFHPEVDYRTAKELVETYREEETVPENPNLSLESWALSVESTDVLRNFVYNIVN